MLGSPLGIDILRKFPVQHKRFKQLSPRPKVWRCIYAWSTILSSFYYTFGGSALLDLLSICQKPCKSIGTIWFDLIYIYIYIYIFFFFNLGFKSFTPNYKFIQKKKKKLSITQLSITINCLNYLPIEGSNTIMKIFIQGIIKTRVVHGSGLCPTWSRTDNFGWGKIVTCNWLGRNVKLTGLGLVRYCVVSVSFRFVT